MLHTDILQQYQIPAAGKGIITCNLTLLFIAGVELHKTVGELPSHSHITSVNTTGGHQHSLPMHMGGDSGTVYARATNGGITHNAITNGAGDHSHTVTISNTGSNQSHENMPPFIAIFCWKRIA